MSSKDNDRSLTTRRDLLAAASPPPDAGLPDAFSYVGEIIECRVAHKAKGYRLADMEWFEQIEHLQDKVREIVGSKTREESVDGICDTLGVLFHMAHFQKASASEVAARIIAKLRLRFEEVPNWHPATAPVRADVPIVTFIYGSGERFGSGYKCDKPGEQSGR